MALYNADFWSSFVLPFNAVPDIFAFSLNVGEQPSPILLKKRCLSGYWRPRQIGKMCFVGDNL